MEQNIEDICQFDSAKLKLLAHNDVWWQKASDWYGKVKSHAFHELSEVQKAWITQMKAKYQQMK